MSPHALRELEPGGGLLEHFVTPKTVENHLGRVYMKVGIAGRRDLATTLG